jgi:hypothetical protein
MLSLAYTSQLDILGVANSRTVSSVWQIGSNVDCRGQCIFNGRTDVTGTVSPICYSVLVTSGATQRGTSCSAFQQVSALVSLRPICVLQTFLWINYLIFYRSKCVCGLLPCGHS